MYTKTNPNIHLTDFLTMVKTVKNFKSKKGHDYQVQFIVGGKMEFVRLTTGRTWSMDLAGVHQAYLLLTDFKTVNFKPYVPLVHSPALGILLHLGLLK